MADFATPGADAFLAGTALPSTLYVQAHTGDPGTNGTANVATETDRIVVNAWTAPAAAGAGYRGISNSQLEELLNAAATESVTHISLWSAASGGTCWFVANVADVSVTAGDTIAIDVGALTIKVPVWV